MTLAEALEVLRTDIRNGQEGPRVAVALEVLRRELGRLVHRVTDTSEYRERAAVDVYDKLLDQALSACLPVIVSPSAYLRTSLRNRVIDLARRTRVAERDLERQQAQILNAAADELEHARRQSAWAGLNTMYGIVRRSIEARHREPNDLAMTTLWRIHEAGETLKEALLSLDPELERDLESFERAAAKVHKAQQRVRKAIATEVAAQVAAGRLSADDGDDILWLLGTLRRRGPNRC